MANEIFPIIYRLVLPSVGRLNSLAHIFSLTYLFGQMTSRYQFSSEKIEIMRQKRIKEMANSDVVHEVAYYLFLDKKFEKDKS